MLTKAVGKFLGRTFTMGMVKVMSGKGKVTTAVGNLVREKQIVRIPIGSNKEVFKRAFPQFEDFMFTLRHDSYKGQGLKTKDFGHLTGITSDGKEIVLMRQNKQNSAFSDITLSFDSNTSVPRNPEDFGVFSSEIQIYHPSDFQIKPTLYTQVKDEFIRSALKAEGQLKSLEDATDEFYRLMREKTQSLT